MLLPAFSDLERELVRAFYKNILKRLHQVLQLLAPVFHIGDIVGNPVVIQTVRNFVRLDIVAWSDYCRTDLKNSAVHDQFPFYLRFI